MSTISIPDNVLAPITVVSCKIVHLECPMYHHFMTLVASARANDRHDLNDGCDLFTAIVITVSASPPIHIGTLIDWKTKRGG